MGIRIISASAGTGKTYTLLNEIFKFVKEGKEEKPSVNYKQMLSNLKETLFVSFSNSAVDEIKRRIFKNILKVLKNENKNIDYEVISSINVKTIHSFALDVLKLYRFEVGISDDLELLDDDGELWEKCVDDFFRNKVNFGNFKTKYMLDENISKAFFLMTDFSNLKKSIKNNGEEIYYLIKMVDNSLFNCGKENFKLCEEEIKTIMSFINKIDQWEKIDNEGEGNVKTYLSSILNTKDFFEILTKIIEDIGDDFIERQERNGYYTFDTAVYRMVERIKSDRNKFLEILKNEGFCFRNIFFDEVQDNSVIQNLIISYLFNAKIDKTNDLNIVIVGDLKQSIYAFRNAIPEYMKKMIEEKNKEIENSVQRLSSSWRLENETLLKNINDICDNITDWDYYYKSKDKLKEERTRINNNLNEKIKLFTTSKKVLNDNIIEKENLEGRIGIVTYGRNHLKKANFLKKIKDFNQNIPINLLFEQKISDMREDKYEETILPEIDFIKILYEIINSNPLSLMYLVFTYQGNKMIEKFMDNSWWNLTIEDKGDKENKEVKKGKISNLKNLLSLTDINSAKIKKNMYHISENLYYNLKDFWSILYHKNIDNIFFGDKDSVIRIINHILYVLYLKETNKRTHFPKTLDFFDFDKLTLPPLNIYFDSNKSEKTIIDINTIHSSKGLEYDCVISILPLEEIFNDSKYTDFRKYNDEYLDFFYIDVLKALTASPIIEINYFPFLKDIRQYLKKNNSDHFLISNLKKHLRNDEINKFYVAITRAKKKLIIFSDICPDFMKDYCIEDRYFVDDANISNGGNNLITYNFLNMVSDNDTKISYPYIVQMKKYSLKSFRLSNTDSITTNNKISQIENIRRMKEGSVIHNIIEKTILKEDSSDILIKDIVNKNAIEEIKKIKNDNSSFLIELPLWRYLEKDNRYIYLKGAVDCVGISADKINLYEFKVVFDESKIHSTKQGAQNQLDEYSKALNLLGNKKIITNPIIIRVFNEKEEK